MVSGQRKDKPRHAMLTRWNWLDRTIGLGATLLFQGGLSVLATLCVMVMHFHFDVNENQPVPLTLWYPAMCLPMLLTLGVFMVVRRRLPAFSQGLLVGIVALSLLILVLPEIYP